MRGTRPICRAQSVMCALMCACSLQSLVADAPKVVDDPDLRKLVKAVRSEFNVPAISVAMVDGGGTIRIAADGVRKAGGEDCVTTADRFHLGSCTKAMTATAIAAVVRTTELRWDSTLEDVLPDLATECHAGFRMVTLRQLVDHQAGLPANSQLMWKVDGSKSLTAQRVELLERALTKMPAHDPGSTYLYSNLGFLLAALMAEKTSGTCWRDLMKEHVFGPLRMKSAGFGPPSEGNDVSQPWGHTLIGDKHQPTDLDNPPVLGPAGRVHATLADWARFARLHLGHIQQGKPANDSESDHLGIDKQMLKMLHKPEDGRNYTCGWVVMTRKWAKGKVLSHSGSNTSWYSVIWVAPGIDRAYLAVVNAGHKRAFSACDAIISQMIQTD